MSERPDNKDNILIFLHIPKAAGTTLDIVIEQQYRSSDLYTIDPNRANGHSLDEFLALSDEQKARIRVLKGHMPYGLHRFLPRPATYITILRDPVERIISHYYYVLRHPEHYLYNEVVSRNMSLKDYVTSGISLELNNDQVRFICDQEPERLQERANADLESAKSNLNQFACVGLTERFDETFLLLRSAMRWWVPVFVTRNVGNNRHSKREIPQDAIRAIETYNDLDLALYEYAQKLFENRIQEQGPGFPLKVKAFRQVNRWYNAAYSTTRRVKYKTKLVLGR